MCVPIPVVLLVFRKMTTLSVPRTTNSVIKNYIITIMEWSIMSVYKRGVTSISTQQCTIYWYPCRLPDTRLILIYIDLLTVVS